LVPFLLAKEFGYTATAITMAVVARPLAFSASAPVAGAVAVKIGDRAAAVVGTSLVAMSMPALALGAIHHSIVFVIAGLVLSGAGNGFSQPPFTASIANSVDESDLGIASASQTVIGQIGAAAGITAMGVIQGGGTAPNSFSRAFLAGGMSAFIGVLVATRMPSRSAALATEAARVELAEPIPAEVPAVAGAGRSSIP
jgi:predicted MFS family arabinose efflux permease